MHPLRLLPMLVCLSVWACAPLQRAGVAHVASNPIVIRANNDELVWERTVSVLHDYQFEIARENRLDGIIETRYKVGASLLEPWHADSVGQRNRLESTLQSIRRRAIVTVTPQEGAYLIGVEAFKEIEDVQGVAATTAGGATFQEATPLQRDLSLVVGQSRPPFWIPRGRDLALEADMLARIRQAFGQ